MKTLKSIFLFILLACFTSIQAEPITPRQARELASQFAQKQGIHLKHQPLHAPGRKASAASQPLYVFNAENGQGFVIVSGDDRTDAIIGYSLQGTYDEADMPDNFRAWMQLVAGEIEELGNNSKYNAQSPMLKSPAIHQRIEPLIQTHWNQGYPTEEGYIYNTRCPKINRKYCYTGCVPTAGAQLMYYYQHPKTEVPRMDGYNNYKNLPSRTFEWDWMRTTYTKDDQGKNEQEAVAVLMVYVGYAAQAKYGLQGTSAGVYTLAKGMVQYFDYNPDTFRYVHRSDYTISTWDEMIYYELSVGRPVIYGGRGKEGGHAFICDGYDGYGLYHFNWGWGGHYDGYYQLCGTNPYRDGFYTESKPFRDGYVNDIYALTGVQPSTSTIPANPYAEDANEVEAMLSATDFSFPGTKLSPLSQPVEVTIENQGGEFKNPLYLFASPTDDKGTYIYMAGTAIVCGGSDVVTFYFLPQVPGTWNLWVATDDAGTNIIGQTEVVIDRAPADEVSLTMLQEGRNVTFRDRTATFSFTAKNTGQETNYRELFSMICIKEEDHWTRVNDQKTVPIILNPGQTEDISITYDDLEDGLTYNLYVYYYTTASTNSRTWMGNYSFTFHPDYTAIETIQDTENKAQGNNHYYTLDGRRLSQRPTTGGIYLHNGKKIVVSP